MTAAGTAGRRRDRRSGAPVRSVRSGSFWPRMRTCSSMTRVALNIADLFEHAVDATPSRPALKVGDRVLTYADLEADANRLAHFLSSRGVQAGEHVALYAKNSIEHVVGLLATLKIRAVSINVNYRYVEGELDYLFDNADVMVLIHERCYAPLVARCAPKHEKLHTFVALPDVTDPDNDTDVSAFGGVLFDDALEAQSAERDFGPRSADDLRVIYTGRTTGFPKGVMWCSGAASTSTPASPARSTTSPSRPSRAAGWSPSRSARSCTAAPRPVCSCTCSPGT